MHIIDSQGNTKVILKHLKEMKFQWRVKFKTTTYKGPQKIKSP